MNRQFPKGGKGHTCPHYLVAAANDLIWRVGVKSHRKSAADIDYGKQK
jgi:hypothetical protein